ncbi:MAG: hypothetical protein V3S04_01145 [Candidatus Omnitrophota bacterium]
MPEGALVVETQNGVSVITGYAHPGIIKIVNTIRKSFPNKNIYTVLGSFHLMDTDKAAVYEAADEFKKTGVQKIGATHCSGPNAEEIFRDRYKNNFINVEVGQALVI